MEPYGESLMPSLEDFGQDKTFKILLCGDSGAGKTGALVSLVEAGYKLRILDLDVGIETLFFLVKQRCPQFASNVHYETRRDKFKTTQTGARPAAPPTAWPDAMSLLDKWSDGTNPSEWGPDYVLVIDTLTALSRAAYNFAERLNPTAKDNRQIFGAAQRMIELLLGQITDEAFNTNVILISHITVNEESGKGYPTSLGKALDNKIAAYFNNFFQVERVGVGDNARRVIRTIPTGRIDLKVSNPFGLPKEVPQDTGLATLATALKGK